MKGNLNMSLSSNLQQCPLLRTTLWIWRSWAGSYMEPSSFISSIFGPGRYSAGYQKRNINTNPITKTLTYNPSCLKDMPGQRWHREYGSSQPMCDWLETYSTRWNPYPILLKWPRIRDKKAQSPIINSNTTAPKR